MRRKSALRSGYMTSNIMNSNGVRIISLEASEVYKQIKTNGEESGYVPYTSFSARKSYIEEKIGRLDKYLENPDEITANVVARVRGKDQNNFEKNDQACEGSP